MNKLYGRFSPLRIPEIAVSSCNRQLETLILGIKSNCKKVIYNACSFFVSRSGSSSEKNTFSDVDIVGKKNKSTVVL